MSVELKAVATAAAPAAIGPYSQGVSAGDLVYVSGQIPLDPATGELVVGDFGAQAQRCLANLGAVLEAAGCSRSRVIKVNVYLTDLGRFAELNRLYADFFGEHRPARAVVGVAALPRGAPIEIEAVAVR
jgi:2-iminobutanoate/2-iminopropanoate deaminase